MKNVLYVIFAGALWGIISIFINLLDKIGLNSMQCVAVRTFFAALILFIYLVITDKSKLKIKLRDLKYFVGTGVFSIVLFNYCYFKAIKVIGGASIPALLLYTAPMFVIIFFNEKITRKKIISLLLTFLGLCFVTGAFGGDEKLSILALVLGLGSGLGYALYSIFGKLVVNKYDAETINFYTFFIASIASVPFSGVVNNIQLICNAKAIFSILGLAVFSTLAPFFLYTKGLTKVEAGKASILATIEPFVATLVGILLFHETFTIVKVIGMLLILVAIIYLNIGKVAKTMD